MHLAFLSRGALKKEEAMQVDRSNHSPVKQPQADGPDQNQTVSEPKKESDVSTSQQQDDDDIVDMEEFFAANKPVPKGKKYRIRIDKEHRVVDVPEMTGRAILDLVGKTPEKFLLRQKLRGGVHPVEPDQVVSFLAPSVERFMTIPNEVTEGEGTQTRRQFALLRVDAEYLDSLGLRWETAIEAGVKATIVYGWPLPAGYNVTMADVHVRFSDGYPDAQIDMAYFAPALSRSDARAINNLSSSEFDGRNWQQWSRHRTPVSAWRPGIDDLSTHMALVDNWLAAELHK
jgi:hypothetical protein